MRHEARSFSSPCQFVRRTNRGFWHIPAKSFNPGFRVDSRLENDPLPPLSVFIDNMHVDEVQIDGSGTEAVITGNMENPGKRLIVLEG
jgi:hypothetical protein